MVSFTQRMGNSSYLHFNREETSVIGGLLIVFFLYYWIIKFFIWLFYKIKNMFAFSQNGLAPTKKSNKREITRTFTLKSQSKVKWVLRTISLLVGLILTIGSLGGYLEGQFGIATTILIFGVLLLYLSVKNVFEAK